MEVILLDKIGRLGGLGDKVKVKNGFARNFLLPNKKAVRATKENLEKFEAQRAELEAKIAGELKAAQDRAAKLEEIGKFTIEALAGDEGKLFGSVGTRDIAEVITKGGVEVHKSEIRLPEGVLRSTGDYQISIQLHPDVKTEVTISIVPQA
ncbi:MAG: 50S ribosomal protein L9 [Aeromonadales bacterium]|nr:50S ribosomal protein L9 [Aeromonadales bacterium]MDY2890181.1 50S ribosomal protein L9 [Succinivibrio sp.]